MSVRLTKKQRETYQKALNGKIKLIGWGFHDNIYLQQWQEQYLIAFYVDARFDLWNRTINGHKIHNPYLISTVSATKHAVVNNYQADRVEAYTNEISKVPVIPPRPLQHVLYEIYDKNESSRKEIVSIDKKEIEQIVLTLGPLLAKLPTNASAKKVQEAIRSLPLYHWSCILLGIFKNIKPKDWGRNTVVLACNSLYPGGAERQIVNCAIGFKKKGWDTHVLATMSEQHAPHYRQTLLDNGMDVVFATKDLSRENPAFIQSLLAKISPEIRVALWHMPTEFLAQIAGTIDFFIKTKPRIVIAYLDWTNIIVAFAALLCGVPEIIISGRNYGPQSFPHFFAKVTDLFHICYNILANCPNVHITNNAILAGEDYAQWLRISRDKISYVPNSLTEHFMTVPSKHEIKQAQKQLHVNDKDKVVLGVFRLSPEKRPHLFIKILANLIKQDKNVRGIICGVGPLQPELERLAKRLKIENKIAFTGLASNVREVMGIADILLHTAEHEGMPNVMLEAQSQALPIVCTKSGGVEDCLAKELLPYAFALNDLKGVTLAATKLLKNKSLRKKIGAAAQRFVRHEFSIAKLVDRNLALTQYDPKKNKKR